MATIHPMAIVDPGARLADDVTVGPFCVVENDVTIGAGTVLRQNVVVRRHTTLGENNRVDPFVCLGGEPQDLKFDPDTVSYVRIGDNNTFREGVTVNRATTPGGATTVGSNTYWMQNAHTAHDTTVGDHCIIAGGAMIAGHSTIQSRAILSGCVLIHQFTWVGEMAMAQGGAAIGQHVPPFCLFAEVNNVVGLNVVGLRRSPEMTDEDRKQIKEAFRLTYRAGYTPAKALDAMDACTDWGAPAGRFREFIRNVVTAEKPFARGLCPQRDRGASRKG
jgi:UDP-N-acetylglucosamine acyltransferase